MKKTLTNCYIHVLWVFHLLTVRRKIITSTMHPPLRNHIYVTIQSFISNNKPQQFSFWIPSVAISEQKSKYRSDLLWFFFQNTNIYTMACTIVYPMYHQSYKDKHKGIILSQIVSLSTLIIHYSWLPFWWLWSWSVPIISGTSLSSPPRGTSVTVPFPFAVPRTSPPV